MVPSLTLSLIKFQVKDNTLNKIYFSIGKHVVFGRVVTGFEVVQAIENTPVDDDDRPIGIAMIAQCGELELKIPPNVKSRLLLIFMRE